MDIYTILIAAHVIGTILGAGGATVAELQIAKALKDKQISGDEKALMHVNYGMIRVGMSIILLSILGMFWYFYQQGSSYLFVTEKLWIKELMFAVIILNAVALHKRWVPLWLGASTSFTSWWGATLLGLAGQLPYSFLTYLLGYVIMIFVVAGISHLLHVLYKNDHMNKKRVTIVVVALLIVIVFSFYFLTGSKNSNQIESTASSDTVITRELSSTVSYEVPGGSHDIEFSIWVDETGKIVEVTGTDITDPGHQGSIDKFTSSLTTTLKGRVLSELEEVDMVGTSSLTTTAFNESLAEIKSQL